MALAREIMLGGLSSGTADAINGQVKTAITAAGTNLATATALTASINIIETAAASTGVSLPNGETSDSVEIFNAGANTITVYPPTALQQINAVTVGNGITLATNTSCWLRKVSTTRWIAFLSA